MIASQDTNERDSNHQLITLGLLARIVVDTSTQMFYAFLPIFAAGIGVTPLVMGRLISLRSIAGLCAPLAGGMTERSGYRPILRASLLVSAFGLLIVAFNPNIWIAGIGMFLVGAGLFSFVPLLQAFASERLSAESRARGMGIIEYSFALSSIVGLFLVGFLIDTFTWRAPLLVMAGLAVAAALTFGRLPPTAKQGRRALSLRLLFEITENRRGVWTAITIGSLVIFGAIHTFSAYSTWLFAEYGFGPRELGLVALAFGVVDICGSVLISLRLDQIGRRRALIIGGLLGVTAFALLPLFAAIALPFAIVGLLCCRFAFEFSMVAAIIVISESAPNQRARATTLSAAVVTLVLAIAGLTGTQAYATVGLLGLSVPSALAYGLIALVAWRGMAQR